MVLFTKEPSSQSALKYRKSLFLGTFFLIQCFTKASCFFFLTGLLYSYVIVPILCLCQYKKTKMLSQRRAIGCIDVAGSLKMRVPPTSIGTILATLKSDVVATMCQRSVKVVTTSQSRNFIDLQRLFDVASKSPQLIFTQ